MSKSISFLLAGMAVFVLGLAAGLLVSASALAVGGLPSKVLLDNDRVKVTEVYFAPGARREGGWIRAGDQVIVWLDEANYDASHADGSEPRFYKRPQGSILWHPKGQTAPLLVNKGEKPFRELVIELK